MDRDAKQPLYAGKSIAISILNLAALHKWAVKVESGDESLTRGICGTLIQPTARLNCWRSRRRLYAMFGKPESIIGPRTLLPHSRQCAKD
jgi:hypothetical protein